MTMAVDKQDKVLNVPPLRFPEFTGEWELRSTTDFFDFKNGLNPEAKRFGSGIKFISVMDILNNRYITYDKIIASVEPKENDLKEFGVNYGDILFQRSSETLEDVGRANVYLDKETALFGGFVIRGRKIGEYNPLFFRYLLSSPHVRKRIVVKGAGAQHFNIGQDGLSKVSLFIPTVKEQEHIAQLLDLIDERIATQIRAIEDLKQLRSAIRKCIFRQIHKDYKPTKQIKDVLSYEQPTKYLVSSDEYSEDSTQIPVLTANKAFTLGYTADKDGIYDKGSCIILDDFTLDSKIVDFPFKVKSSAIKILTAENNATLRYMYEYLKFQELETTEHKRHYITEIEPIEIVLPTSIVINQIAKLFETLDKRISNAEKLYSSFLNQKQYLLQSMFI